MKLGISPLAEQDMEAIGDYIAQDNPVRAVSFTEELYQQCLLIAESPVIYREGRSWGRASEAALTDAISSCSGCLILKSV
jgi:plasmid stabilization system protein ParE